MIKGERVYKIYCLKCPTTKRVRYVGVTVSDLRVRLSQHVHDAKKGGTHKRYWINSLSNRPIIELIETCNKDNWEEKERFWIAHFNNLTNTREGGAGIVLSKSETSKQRSIEAKYKPITAISIDKKVRYFDSVRECSISLRVPSSSITWVLRFSNRSAYGYHFVETSKYYIGYEHTVKIKKKHNKLKVDLIFNGKKVEKKKLAVLLNCKERTITSWIRKDRDHKKSILIGVNNLEIIHK